MAGQAARGGALAHDHRAQGSVSAGALPAAATSAANGPPPRSSNDPSAAVRVLAEASADRLDGTPAIHLQLALAGGAIFDTRSPHYRDLLDQSYLADQPFAAPDTIDDIVAAGETRWVFH